MEKQESQHEHKEGKLIITVNGKKKKTADINNKLGLK